MGTMAKLAGIVSRPIAILVNVSVLLLVSVAAQRQPSFSGNWELVEALYAGPSRGPSGSPAAKVEDPMKIHTIGAAAFNCGRHCTITHEGQILVIDSPQLREDNHRDKPNPTPAVTLHLDGRKEMVVDSLNPHRTLPVTATWQANKLQIDSSDRSDPLAITQSISLEGTQLVVISIRFLNGERYSETTFKYKKMEKHR